MINWTYTDEEMLEVWPSRRMDVVVFMEYLKGQDRADAIPKFLDWMENSSFSYRTSK